MDPDDTEMSLVRQQVTNEFEPGQLPDLVDVTYAAHKCIVDQVKKTAESVVNPDKCEYVIISGIQIHGPLNKNFIYPGSITKYIGGVATDLTSDYQTAIKDYTLSEWLQSEASSEVRAKDGRLPSLFSDIKL